MRIFFSGFGREVHNKWRLFWEMWRWRCWNSTFFLHRLWKVCDIYIYFFFKEGLLTCKSFLFCFVNLPKKMFFLWLSGDHKLPHFGFFLSFYLSFCLSFFSPFFFLDFLFWFRFFFSFLISILPSFPLVVFSFFSSFLILFFLLLTQFFFFFLVIFPIFASSFLSFFF